MIQLTTASEICTHDPDDLARKFAREHVLRLPQLLGPDLMRIVSIRLERCNWTPRDHGKIGRELASDNQSLAHVLNFVANSLSFIEFIRRITRCDAIVRFEGRVYRMLPNSDHYDSWHNDCIGDRLVGMSVNLGLRPYRGGVFRLRTRSSTKDLRALPNTGAGDAILFRISSDLMHRVSSVSGTEAKTAFAGWFQSGEDNHFTAIRRTSQASV